MQKLGCRLAPSDEGDSPRCGEMSRSDRGDRRRQRLASAVRLRERKSCVFCSFTPSLPPSRQSRATSQLPFRSVLLSLRLEIATGNPHPRQREARIVETPTFRIEPLFLREIRNCCYYCCCSCSDCCFDCSYSDCCSGCSCSGCSCSDYSCSGCFPLESPRFQVYYL